MNHVMVSILIGVWRTQEEKKMKIFGHRVSSRLKLIARGKKFCIPYQYFSPVFPTLHFSLLQKKLEIPSKDYDIISLRRVVNPTTYRHV